MELLCGKCGSTLNVVWDQAGQDIQCPHCGHTIHVPAMDDSLPPADEHYPGEPVEAAGETDEDDFLTKAKLLLQRKLLLVCGSCGERLTVEQRLAGKVLRCPACGGQIHIPLQADEESFPDVGERMEVLDITAEEPPPPADTAAYLAAESDKDAGPNRWTVAIILIVMTGLAGVVIGYILRGHGGEKPPEDKPPISTVPVRPKPPTIKPTTTPVVVVTTKPIIPPSKPQTAVKVLRAKTEVLAYGLTPAPLGKTFLFVTTNIFSGRTALDIDTTGGAVVLDSEAGKISPLGLAATDSIVPRSARASVISIPPAATRLETFVFLVPEEFDGGKLTITGVGEAELPALPAFSAPDPSAIIGEYVEAGRYLRVAFENPIMERLRAGGVHRLVIRKRGERLAIALPPTRLRGMAHSANAGTFAAMLTDGKTHLQCHLRLIDSGKRLILYLSEKPFHQIIYKKK